MSEERQPGCHPVYGPEHCQQVAAVYATALQMGEAPTKAVTSIPRCILVVDWATAAMVEALQTPGYFVSALAPLWRPPVCASQAATSS